MSAFILIIKGAWFFLKKSFVTKLLAVNWSQFLPLLKQHWKNILLAILVGLFFWRGIKIDNLKDNLKAQEDLHVDIIDANRKWAQEIANSCAEASRNLMEQAAKREKAINKALNEAERRNEQISKEKQKERIIIRENNAKSVCAAELNPSADILRNALSKARAGTG